MVRLRLLFASLAFIAVFGASASSALEADSSGSLGFSEAVEIQRQADETFIGKVDSWDATVLRDLVHGINSYSEDVGLQIVWLLAQAPARVDSVQLLAVAMSAREPSVRAHAADALMSTRSADTQRLILSRLSAESDPDVLVHIVNGWATQSNPNAAIRNMIDIMYASDMKDIVIKTAAGHLRRLTPAEFADNVGDWRDWWLDNEQFYE